jgi:hypothetical protein
MHGHMNVKNRNMLSIYYIYYFREKNSSGVWVGLIRTCDVYKTEPVPVGLQEGPVSSQRTPFVPEAAASTSLPDHDLEPTK